MEHELVKEPSDGVVTIWLFLIVDEELTLRITVLQIQLMLRPTIKLGISLDCKFSTTLDNQVKQK